MAKTHYFLSNGITIATDNPEYYSKESGNYTKISKAEYDVKRRAECLEKLHKFVKQGDTIYCVLRHVSSSGMSRRIDFYAIGEDRKPVYLTGYIEGVLSSYKRHKDGSGLIVGGCGMDMGFHVVYNVSSVMFPNQDRGGYLIKSEWI